MKFLYTFIWSTILLTACVSPTINSSNLGKALPVKPVIKIDNPDRTCLDRQQPIVWASPDYPRAAFDNKQNGWVALEFDLVNGEISNLKLIDSSPEGVFDKIVLESVSKWRWAKTTNGTSCVTILNYNFF